MPLYHKGEVLCGSSFPGAEIYSTEEVRTGTWIDGKPVYKRTFIGVGPASTSGWHTISNENTVENIETVVSIHGMIHPGSNYGWVPFPQTTSGQSVYINIIYNPGEDSSRPIGLSCFTNSPPFVKKPLWVTMRYTKTTD